MGGRKSIQWGVMLGSISSILKINLQTRSYLISHLWNFGSAASGVSWRILDVCGQIGTRHCWHNYWSHHEHHRHHQNYWFSISFNVTKEWAPWQWFLTCIQLNHQMHQSTWWHHLQILSRKKLVQLLTRYYQFDFLKPILHTVLHIWLVADYFMQRCQEWGTMAATEWRWPPWSLGHELASFS